MEVVKIYIGKEKIIVSKEIANKILEKPTDDTMKIYEDVYGKKFTLRSCDVYLTRQIN